MSQHNFSSSWSLPEPSPDTTRKSEDAEDKLTKTCRQKGRWVNVAICFGIDLQDVFKVGIKSGVPDLGEDNSNDDDNNLTVEQKRLYFSAYRAILKLVPELRDLVSAADGDARYLYDVVNAMQEGCNAARSEAIRRIKDNTVKYLGSGRTPVKVDAQVDYKALRGLNDPNTGRLLIPADSLQEWDEDPHGMRAAYLSGMFPIWGNNMPTFLYEDYTYNPEDPEEGLFRGSFLVCVLIDILFGSNSVDAKYAKRIDQHRHHCLGEMYKISTISPENIAFSAVVARFCLSSKRMWSLRDDNFNYKTFYQAIVSRLADDEDPWVQETLIWWNERVFGNERGRLRFEETEESDEIWQQFTRRRAGRKAASRAMEARARVLGAGSTEGTPTRGASQGDANPRNSDAEAATPHEDPGAPPYPIGIVNTGTIASLGSPFTPGRQPSPPIDPRLLDTPDLDRSTMTQPSPPDPQTPDAPTLILHQNSSPLSNVTDGDTPAGPAEKTGQSLKRKRPGSTTDRPKTRAKRRAARA